MAKARPRQMFIKYKPDTFIGKFMTHMENTETPAIYDIWCALWLLGCAVGGRSIVPRPNAPVNLNVYAILVATSGVTRKSTAVRVADKIINKFMQQSNEQTPVITTKLSPEAFVAELHRATEKTGKAHAVLCVSELMTILGKEKYVNAMPGLLTDLYDCPQDRRSFGTLVRGATHLKDVHISFLSASTPAWLLESVNPNVVEGGFTSRCVFVCAEKRKKLVAWAEEKERDDSELVDLLLKVRETSMNVREIRLYGHALDYFRRWYRKREEHTDAFRASFESREDAHVLKLAALLSINRNAWKISVDDLQNAIAIIDTVKADGAAIFEDIAEKNDFARVIDKMRGRLIAASTVGIYEDDLVRDLRNLAPSAWIRHALRTMHELGMIHKVESKLAGVTRVICVAVDGMLNADKLTTLLHQTQEVT